MAPCHFLYQKPLLLSLLLFSYPLFLLICPPVHPLHSAPSSSSPFHPRFLLQSPQSCPSIPIDYRTLHLCLFNGNPRLSLPFLVLVLVVYFRFLALAAGRHFSPAVSQLVHRLRLSPSMAGVTLLALGNGAPDAFSTAAALRSGLPRAGLAAILSAGAFVSAFVVGAVAIQAAPFPLKPAPFVRDVFFYLIAALALFYIYLSAEIYLWQAAGFILFYLFFVGFVFYMDYLSVEENRERGVELEMGSVDREEVLKEFEEGKDKIRNGGLLSKVTQIFDLPAVTLLKLTVPSEHKNFYTSANIALCPILIAYSLSSVVPLNTRIVFFLPATRFPLWCIILLISLLMAISHYFFERNSSDEEKECVAVTLISFVMSVFWISTIAGELLNCLAAIGTIMDLPPAILGLTVLAWGNSIGDLVADVALAKAGQPEVAIAGCFAGPMFNMLVGLGTGLVVQSARVYPDAYKLQFNINIVFAFVFLLLSLMSSLLVVMWNRFRVPRFWGYSLVGLYIVFTIASLFISRYSG
ncbi:hypothetical protein LUZ63_013184 [Rhynchospora breviuscula]|uniref:Sodium/calcium exchanger membrane region domain-containing protein n=1 Tax=Rhynchospora breviuscula TaxID=2022672 RepID=A0A9Q0C8E4_9POAL|nr:hypothetical protein LUZ63_013184 [Rhynchospora breviuscula]